MQATGMIMDHTTDCFVLLNEELKETFIKFKNSHRPPM
ncbi:hypothetical protein LEP1GSC124_3707 [Leptospira interrogans serovar Pyrogenes str. 200701872]|nr:hypothetical protein LEP1GSC124_3707 [Leptospira interrogans serovar Pyrogenes str. 200701872]